MPILGLALIDVVGSVVGGGLSVLTVIIATTDLNGGEEAGQAGSTGLRQHRWFNDVVAWLDLEGSRAGKAALLISTPRYPC